MFSGSPNGSFKFTPLPKPLVVHYSGDNEVAEQLRFTGSASNANCALRTLRRLLHKAEDWKLIRRAPKIKLLPENERSLRIAKDI
jgi:hypothetical protein